MASSRRPELVAPPEVFYGVDEAAKYTRGSRVSDVQKRITTRALELLNLPSDGVPRCSRDGAGCRGWRDGTARWWGRGEPFWSLNSRVYIFRLILDLGCGSGLSGDAITAAGHKWVGLDISQAMLDTAVEREADGDVALADMGQVGAAVLS